VKPTARQGIALRAATKCGSKPGTSLPNNPETGAGGASTIAHRPGKSETAAYRQIGNAFPPPVARQWEPSFARRSRPPGKVGAPEPPGSGHGPAPLRGDADGLAPPNGPTRRGHLQPLPPGHESSLSRVRVGDFPTKKRKVPRVSLGGEEHRPRVRKLRSAQAEGLKGGDDGSPQHYVDVSST
jgi:hypothetical protein